MTILLLRHAHAGDRATWNGDDRQRPLSERGDEQAARLVATYAEHGVRRILSSPYTRCVQTVEPLAAAYDLTVEEDDALAEGAPLDLVHRLLRRVSDTTTVLCSHGDVIGMVITDLHHRGLVAAGALRWAKASTWILEPTPAPPPAGTAPDAQTHPDADDEAGSLPVLQADYLDPPT